MKLIEGVKIKQLRVIPDERGRLMEILRKDDDIFIKFGQVYVTTVYPGVVKAWHYHKKQTDNIACIWGMIKLVLYDSRNKSKTYKLINEFFIGIYNPLLIQIPPLVYHGFKGISENESIVINCPTHVYNYNQPDEFRIPPHSKDQTFEKIPYDWTRVDR
jgi:dTDP-4-dehydrorhamnose 3,5-epimerase